MPPTASFRPPPSSGKHQTTALEQMMAEVALRQMREAFDGRLVLYKGLELANRYENPSERRSGDIDVITDEPEALAELLISVGYEYTGHPMVQSQAARSAFESLYSSHHHLWPLVRPGWPVVVEVHRSPAWLPGMTPPSAPDLLATATASRTGIEGLETLEPAAHAVCVAVHSWRDRPFARPGDLLDIELLLDSAETIDRADRLAADWGVARIWGWYRNAIAATHGSERAVPAVRLLRGNRLEPRKSSRQTDYLVRSVGRILIDHPVQQRAALLRELRAAIFGRLRARRTGGRSAGSWDE